MTTGLRVLAGAWALLSTANATAAVLCVDPLGAGGCFTTIQEAVDAARAGDTIQVAAGTYQESIDVPDGARLTISGAGAASTIVDAGGVNRVLLARQRVRLVIEGLTLRNGLVSAVDQIGGGINLFARTRLTVRDAVVRDNTAPRGGGIAAGSSTHVTIERTTVAGNTATGDGGGIYVDNAPVTISDSTIEGNAAARGAGINSYGGRLRVSNSTISGNVASDVGGGFLAYNDRAFGGGSTHIAGVTIAGNSAGNQGGGLEVRGGRTRLAGTVVGDNVAPQGPDCHSAAGFLDPPARLVSKGYNLVESDADCVLAGDTATNVVGSDPLLAPLASNGGPTQTRALVAGSPAIDTGHPVVGQSFFQCRAQDQRGMPRNARCDIGAFEF